MRMNEVMIENNPIALGRPGKEQQTIHYQVHVCQDTKFSYFNVILNDTRTKFITKENTNTQLPRMKQ